MGCIDDTPLLPGDWGAVDQERESILRARRLQAERDLARTLLAEFEDWLRKDEREPDEVITVMRTVRQLLQFKDDVLGSTKTLERSEELVSTRDSVVLAHKLPEGLDDHRDAAVDLLPFVSFLEETKRWRKRPLRGYEARMLLFSLAYPDPEDWGPGVVL